MIIAIAHSKGGVGKSTIAFNLAVEFSKTKLFKHVEIIDLDFQKTTTYANKYRELRRLQPLPIKTFDDIGMLKSYFMSDVDDRLSIVDVGGFDSDINRLTILGADLVVTPVSASGRELLGLKRFEKILGEMSVKKNIVVNVLLNNINPQVRNIDHIKEFIAKSNHFDLLSSIVRKRVDLDYSMDEGKSASEYNPDGKASKEIKDLFKEIKKLIKKERQDG